MAHGTLINAYKSPAVHPNHLLLSGVACLQRKAVRAARAWSDTDSCGISSSAGTGHDELRGRAAPPQFCSRRESSPAQERARRARDGCVLRQLRLSPAECSERAKASWVRPRRVRVYTKPLPMAQRTRSQFLSIILTRKQQPVVHRTVLRLPEAVPRQLARVRGS